MSKILIVDDEAIIRATLREILEYEKYEVEEAGDAKKALEALEKQEFKVILSDIKMPGMNGLEFLEELQKKENDIPVIMITGHGDVDTAVEALKKGAFDFIQKPLDLNRLLVSVRNAFEREQLVIETKKLKKKINKRYEIIVKSAAIEEVKDMIERVAPTNTRVLITGENGTGKELVAHWLHEKSQRYGNPFIEVNCAAIPSELIESELFGHEKGAFTGANFRRIGKFEEANEGTLFLDEIADLDIALQAKLLRALQEREFTRVGSNTTIKTNCRIIIATNRNLQEETDKGNFRQDLFFRLYGLPIELPPLRMRENDVILLANYFIQNFCKENQLPPKSLSTEAIEQIMAYPFPGNIRELKSIMDLAVTLSDDEKIEASCLVFSKKDPLVPIISDELTLRDYELLILKSYLKKYNNDIKEVAQKLNIGVATIYRMLKE